MKKILEHNTVFIVKQINKKDLTIVIYAIFVLKDMIIIVHGLVLALVLIIMHFIGFLFLYKQL